LTLSPIGGILKITGRLWEIQAKLMKLLICVPTYNEAENIEPFIASVFENSPPDAEILVIDDSSPDGTAGIVENLQKQYGERLKLIVREGKQGGATAFLLGFSFCLENNYGAALAMDADFSHDPKYIPAMLEKLKTFDVVCGSRLVPGGGIENRSFLRDLISRGASVYCRLLLGFKIKDWTGGYNLWSAKALAAIDPKSVVTRGYSFQFEMKHKALCSGCTVAEVPIIFPDRAAGVSKMSGSYFIKALLDVPRIKLMCLNNTLKQLIKFAITGGLGTITNLIIFFLLVDKLHLPEAPVMVFCFLVAGTQNYIINHKWSFARIMRDTALSIKKWFEFLCGALAGLAVNMAVTILISHNFNLPYKVIAQACGILAGMFVNFTVSKLVVFKKQKKGDSRDE